MRVLVPAVVALLMAAPVADSQDAFKEGSVTRTDTSGQPQRFPYRLLAPKSVETDRRYPLLLFLHGAGERGDDNEAQLRHLPERFVGAEGRARFDGFVLAPQCRLRQRWVDAPWDAKMSTPTPEAMSLDLAAAVASLRAVVREHPIDLDRIYLAGLSLGGYGSWDLACRHPEWFAGVVPVCGGGDERVVSRLIGLPLWACHGAEDTVVPPRRSRAMIDALRTLGERPGYSEYPDVGHDSWNRAFAPGGPLDWMFRKKNTIEDLPDRVLPRLVRVLNERKTPRRILFLGDSITESGDRPGGYVYRIRRGVEKVRDLEIIGAGISGNRVPDLLARLDKDVIARKPDVVVVYIGINDVWHHENGQGTSEADYESGLDELLTRLKKGDTKVLLATPSVIGEAPGEQRHDARLGRYAAISRKLAAAHDARIIDLRKLFLDVLAVRNPDGKEKGILTTDGVHLNSDGNALVAYAMMQALSL